MAIVLLDLFDGPNGQDIGDHTPDIDTVGGGWTDGAPDTYELDGSGALKAAGTGSICFIDVGTSNQATTIQYNAGGADNRITLRVRANASFTTYYNINIRPDDASKPLILFRVVSGVSTEIASSNAVSFDLNTTYSIRGEVTDGNVKVFVEGVEYINVNDAVIASGNYTGLGQALFNTPNGRIFSIQTDDQVSSGNEITGNFSTNKPIFSSSITNETVSNEVSVNYSAKKPVFSASIQNEQINNASSVAFTVKKPIFSASINNSAGTNASSVSYSVKKPIFNIDINNSAGTNLSNVNFTVKKPIFSASILNVNGPNESAVDFAIDKPVFSANIQNGDIVVKFNTETNYSQEYLSTNYDQPYLSTNYTQD